MPLRVAACLSALALWFAENLGTATGTFISSVQGKADRGTAAPRVAKS